MDLDRNISEMSEEDLVDFYNEINGYLNSSKTNLTERLKLAAILEDIEDAAKEMDIDL